jgi:hypothetical protein
MSIKHGNPLSRGPHAAKTDRYLSWKYWLCGSLLIAVSCANAAPCDRVSQPLTSAQRSNLSIAVAGQLQAATAKVLHAYRLGNWYLLYADTPDADEAFVFYRGDPISHQYVALWSGAGAKAGQSELRSWARLNAPGVPETIAKCFAWRAVAGRTVR